MTEGLKFDDGKLDYSLVKGDAEAEFVAVLSYGAVKYDRDNWKSVEDARNRYYSAMRRHLKAYRGGQQFDPETGLHHLAHAKCCLHFLLELELMAHPEELGARFEVRFAGALEKAREIRKKRAVCDGYPK